MKDDMEITPVFSAESDDETHESQPGDQELVGDELRNELSKEAGHIVVNPLADDVDFSVADEDEDEDGDA